MQTIWHLLQGPTEPKYCSSIFSTCHWSSLYASGELITKLGLRVVSWSCHIVWHIPEIDICHQFYLWICQLLLFEFFIQVINWGLIHEQKLSFIHKRDLGWNFWIWLLSILLWQTADTTLIVHMQLSNSPLWQVTCVISQGALSHKCHWLATKLTEPIFYQAIVGHGCASEQQSANWCKGIPHVLRVTTNSHSDQVFRMLCQRNYQIRHIWCRNSHVATFQVNVWSNKTQFGQFFLVDVWTCVINEGPLSVI